MERIIFISGFKCDQYSDKLPVANQHYSTEQYLRNLGVNHCSLRPNAFFQNYLYSSTLSNIIQHSSLCSPTNSSVSSIDVRDVATIATKMLIMSNENFSKFNNTSIELTGNQSFSSYEASLVLSEILNKKDQTFLI